MRNNTNIIHVVIDAETLGTVASMLKKGTCPILQAAFTTVKYYLEDSQWRLSAGDCFTFSLGNQNEMDACADTVNWHITNNNENYVSQLKASLDAQLDSADYFRQALEYLHEQAKEDGVFSHLPGAMNSHLSVQKAIEFIKSNNIKEITPIHVGGSTRDQVMYALDQIRNEVNIKEVVWCQKLKFS